MKRRSFLQTLSAAPSLSAVPVSIGLINAAHAAVEGSTATNFVFFYSPDGCTPQHWHPNVVNGELILNKQTSVLEDIKQHMVFINGMNMYNSNGNPGSGSHEGGIKRVLTANATESIDMFLGREIQKNTPMPYANMHLGVFANAMFSNDARMSYNLAGKEPTYLDDPVHAFLTHFKGLAQTPKDRRRNFWAIDNINRDLNALKGQLGYAQIQKLNVHSQAIFELEQRMKNPPDTSSVGCSDIIFNPSDIDTSGEKMHDDNNADKLFDLQSDVAVHALTCGLTRVVSLSLSHKVSPQKFGLNFGEHHATSHSVSDAFDALKSYSNTKFSQLIKKLDNQGLLENTIVFHCSEVGNSNSHGQSNMPFMLAGQGAFNIAGGRQLNLEGASHARLLTTFAHMAGLTHVERYGMDGKADHKQGPLSELID